MEANQEKRNKYQEIIKPIPKEKLVFFDVSAIERAICNYKGLGKKEKSSPPKRVVNIISGQTLLLGMLIASQFNT